MKEQLYALFPPASEVLKTRHWEDTDSYTKECLYRQERTRIFDRSANKVKSEIQEEEAKIESSPVIFNGTRTGRPMTSMYPRPPSTTTTPVVRSRSVAAESRDRWSPPWTAGRSSHALTDRRVRLAETSTAAPVVQPHQPPAEAAKQPTGRPRVRSAFVQRPVIAVPAAAKRPIRSARPITGDVTRSDRPSEKTDAEETSKSLHQPTIRPNAPTPHRWMEEKELVVGEEEEEEETMPTDYDQQLKTFGWKMEIPGDPFCLKRSCIGKRLPTTVVVSLHPSDRKNNSCQAQSSETFFYNTIPRHPMSFTVHPDWASEVHQARRTELRSREGRAAEDGGLAPPWRRRRAGERQPFVRYADFSFVY